MRCAWKRVFGSTEIFSVGYEAWAYRMDACGDQSNLATCTGCEPFQTRGRCDAAWPGQRPMHPHRLFLYVHGRISIVTTLTLIRKPMFAIIAFATALTVVIGASEPAAADFGSWLHRQKMTYFRNSAWPDPFNEADARQVVEPFEIMKNNGWRTHNTIGHNLFRAGDGALLASGHARVRWIATQSPDSRRNIHVLKGRTQEETAARVASVQDACRVVLPEGVEAQIFVTTIEPATTPGALATKINRDRLENTPVPRLPTSTASGQDGVAAQ